MGVDGSANDTGSAPKVQAEPPQQDLGGFGTDLSKVAKTGTFGPEDVHFTPSSTLEEIETDRLIEQEEKIAPLAMDKTAASRK